MNQTAIFRCLVVASMALAVLGSCVDLLVPGLLPTVLEDAYAAYSAADELTMSHALMFSGFALVLLVGIVAGTIGLLLFRPWARPLSLWSSVLGTLSYTLLGPVVYSGWATMLTETSMMFWGAALAMAWFGDIKVRFERVSDRGNGAGTASSS